MSSDDEEEIAGSPSLAWRDLFVAWRGCAATLDLSLKGLSDSARSLLASSGDLCHAIALRSISVESVPEARAILLVARGAEAPRTALQTAWLEYQELQWKLAVQERESATIRLASAKAEIEQFEYKLRASESVAVPPHLVAQHEQAGQDLMFAVERHAQLVARIEAVWGPAAQEFDQAIMDGVEVQQDLEARKNQQEQALGMVFTWRNGIVRNVASGKARNLLKPQEPPPPPRRSETSKHLRYATQVYEICRGTIDLLADCIAHQDAILKLQHTLRLEERSQLDLLLIESEDQVMRRRLAVDGLQAQIEAVGTEAKQTAISGLERAQSRAEIEEERVLLLDSLLPPPPNPRPFVDDLLRPRNLSSYIHLHLRARRPTTEYVYQHPATFREFRRVGSARLELLGHEADRCAVQRAFPAIVQERATGIISGRERLQRWIVDLSSLQEREQVDLERLLAAMRGALCLSTAMDECFALDWYMTADGESPGQSMKRTEIGEMLYVAKYMAQLDKVDLLVDRLTEFIQRHPLYRAAPIIVSVPHIQDKKFDLPRALAEKVAHRVGKRDSQHGVRKLRPTRPMKEIEIHTEKLNNIHGAFEADANEFAGEDVIVIDDTFGSGATLWELTRALRYAGARRVLALTCAKNRSKK